MTDIPALLVDAAYRLHPDDAAAFRSLALRMADVARRRDGCGFVKVTQDLLDPTTFRFFEGWRDRQALEAHFGSDDFRKITADAGELRIFERSGDTYSVAARAPLQAPS
ncbi:MULTISPECIES: putative quinol monooxygenase [Sphingomonas]|uniref:ABM domain-containing protein n=2 Tax=Sphingomonas TaxID=13687 RepID=A0A2A4I1K6_9SPHN|nr:MULTISPECIES: antibiotic biosynthesis monooxygenase [Sphingomonas]NJC35345.1 quinol monooxygenase YgiN [Sphingomonas jejuensis]PCG09797.1 hypothetical protein COA17_08120 [Sphingomonas ginsenosidimutans]